MEKRITKESGVDSCLFVDSFLAPAAFCFRGFGCHCAGGVLRCEGSRFLHYRSSDRKSSLSLPLFLCVFIVLQRPAFSLEVVEGMVLDDFLSKVWGSKTMVCVECLF